ncbi:hypothetical protein RhiirA5_431862 [Rhizophagus irregularis]|uniref:HMG box domain-containing protein n=3 Tax=Rhizophagus irregularis TaxID=588596 RepID=U9T6Z1_RHIID|nr:hypothetical protein GLOIN_2v1771727 [Rhizophagus irregularis DAOM 181602=DAOM 197198]EXX67871.1 hypothetical protein RirG_110350 [Rhizophagus irregularis DAOM 197198w]PKB98141.1 hypothetical protein RhiirA5_431862 [Rhizophagus irregularis]POG74113.1 hypothetical protein GLOIN_2v1771727 [Rhizophagus irregularis DAOM 181602=DAOM 197198]UZO05530.1 hypothetical protein OCT59_025878 [Rhizophagus irregularis]GBC12456.1 hypothetical protein GLOIN_2v1771727 [Rhizophagus irregularis DAOM 181602=DAO|eukprot:XP_025180979.1 hypothetical protein GLOIN_2v1771727 [Rhizophagus irregularis DAOM 181602=DAOM 197198]
MKIRRNNRSRPANGFSIFVKFYTRKYKNQNSQERMKNASKIWKSLPNEVKNDFIKYAHDEHILKVTPPVVSIPTESAENRKPPIFIFDEKSTKPHYVKSTETSNPFSSLEEFFDFEKYINDNDN